MTLPSLAYAGIPYQVFGSRAGALAVMIAWTRLAMERSRAGISAIFASMARSPSSRRPAALCSRARSFIAARSSAVNPVDFFWLAVVVFADFFVPFFAGFLSAIAKHLRCRAHRLSIQSGGGGDLVLATTWPSGLSSLLRQTLLRLFVRAGRRVRGPRVDEVHH